MRETRQMAGLSLDRCRLERRAEFRASQLSGAPLALLDSDRLTLTVIRRMANAQARFANFAVPVQYGILCCPSCRIQVFGGLVLPGQRRDLFFGAAGPKRDVLYIFLSLFWLVVCSHSSFFLTTTSCSELHHHQQSSRVPEVVVIGCKVRMGALVVVVRMGP